MKSAWSFIVAVARGFQRHQGSQAASAIAYQVLFAIVPLTGLLLAVFGFVLREPQQRTNAIEALLEALPLQSNAFVTESIRTIARRRVALTTLSLALFLWSATGLFGAIRGALNTAWEVRQARSFLRGKLNDVFIMTSLGVLLATSMTGTVAIHFVQTVGGHAPNALAFRELLPLITAAGIVLPAVFSFVSFMLLYRVVPNTRHRFRDIWMGAMVATLLFEAGKNAFALYVSRFGKLSTAHGALGDVMLFMLWMWVSACILLIGAEVSAEFCRMTSGHKAEEAEPPAEDAPPPVRASRTA